MHQDPVKSSEIPAGIMGSHTILSIQIEGFLMRTRAFVAKQATRESWLARENNEGLRFKNEHAL